MSEEQQWVKTERKRYEDNLRLNYSHWSHQQGVFTDLRTTIKLLQQMLALSQTAEGRAKIHKIYPYIMSYRFMDLLKIYWQKQAYWQFDNLALRIMVNLTADPLFSKESFDMKVAMLQLPGNITNNTFRSLCAQVSNNIKMIEQKMKQQTKTVQYKQSFANKEEAIIELRKHDDILNFSCSSVHFDKEYPHYIGMLLGALQVGARQQVMYVFPKSCFGCVTFSMIVTSNRCNRKDLALSFLQKLTDGWFTGVLFDLLFSNIKSLYRHLKYNQDLQDRGELVCLRMTQYERTKPIYQYLSNCSSKLSKGQLNQMKRVVNEEVLYYAIEKIRYKDKLSQESSNIRSQYRQMSKKSKQYFQVSKILSADQTAIMRETLIKRIQGLGYEIKQANLRYCYQQSLHKYNFKNFLSYVPSQTVLVVKCKNGNILFGYFQTSSSYSKRIGHAYIFEFSQLNTFEIGGEYDCMNLNKKKIHRNKKSSKQQKLEQHGQLEQQDGQEAFYASRKFREEERYYSFGRRQFGGFEDSRQRSDNSQPFSSSDEEKQNQKKSQYSHKICFSFPRDEFKMSLKVKQSQTTVKKTQITDKQSQLAVKQDNLKEQPVEQSELTVKQGTVTEEQSVKQSQLTVKQSSLTEEQANWKQFFLKSCDGKMQEDEIRIQLQGLQIFDLDCKELK